MLGTCLRCVVVAALLSVTIVIVHGDDGENIIKVENPTTDSLAYSEWLRSMQCHGPLISLLPSTDNDPEDKRRVIVTKDVNITPSNDDKNTSNNDQISLLTLPLSSVMYHGSSKKWSSPDFYNVLASLDGADALPSSSIDPIIRISPTIHLALFLMQQDIEGLNSSFASFLATLPRTFSTALYYSQEDMHVVRGSRLPWLVERRNIEIETDYSTLFLGSSGLHTLYPLLFPSNHYTLEKFRWALSIIWQRAIWLSLDPKKSSDSATSKQLFAVPVIIPIVDAFSHDPNSSLHISVVHSTAADLSEISDADKVSIVLSTNISLKAGTELSISRGFLPSTYLLLNFGTLLSYPNPHESVSVTGRPSPDDPFHSVKSRLLLSVNLPPEYEYFLTGKPDVAPTLLFALRIDSMTLAELEGASNFGMTQRLIDTASRGPISLTNERSSLAKLRSIISSIRDGFLSNDDPEVTETVANASVVDRYRRSQLLALRDREINVLNIAYNNVLRMWRRLLVSFPLSNESPRQEQVGAWGVVGNSPTTIT